MVIRLYSKWNLPVKVVRLHVESHLVLQPDPGEGEGVGDHVVKLRVVENDSVVNAGVQIEKKPYSNISRYFQVLDNICF